MLTFDPSGEVHEFAAWDEKHRRLNLSGEYFGTTPDLRMLGSVMAALERAGENPRGCNSPDYLVTHELGHCLLQRLDMAKYERWWRTSACRAMGMNALRSAREGFAEGFAMLNHSPEGQWPQAVSVLREMLREDGVL